MSPVDGATMTHIGLARRPQYREDEKRARVESILKDATRGTTFKFQPSEQNYTNTFNFNITGEYNSDTFAKIVSCLPTAKVQRDMLSIDKSDPKLSEYVHESAPWNRGTVILRSELVKLGLLAIFFWAWAYYYF